MTGERQTALDDLLKRYELPAVRYYVQWGQFLTDKGLRKSADDALEEMAQELLKAQDCITARGSRITRLLRTIDEQEAELRRLEDERPVPGRLASSRAEESAERD